MAQKHTQKLATLQAEIATLTTQAREIEVALAQEIVNLLRKTDAFSLDFDTLIGGILEIIRKTKTNTPEQEVWQQAGRSFRKSYGKTRTKNEVAHNA
jgi:type I restriction-modification system DNA methylase subunit